MMPTPAASAEGALTQARSRSPRETPSEEGGEMQLPRFLRRKGEKAHFRFTVGDDLDSARRDGALDLKCAAGIR